jgi:hypothetical protein
LCIFRDALRRDVTGGGAIIFDLCCTTLPITEVSANILIENGNDCLDVRDEIRLTVKLSSKYL